MDRILECPICTESYNENIKAPRLLPKCYHTICSACLELLYENDKLLTCPICRLKNLVLPKDVPKNRDILQFLEYFNNSKNSKQETNIKIKITKEWDETKYLKGVFDDIDHNGDGQIDTNELHEALKKGQSNSTFDLMTVRILMQKYDTNFDGEISFDEFYRLFLSINQLINDFLDYDLDSSGSIEPNELRQLLISKGFNLSESFYEYLFDILIKRLRYHKISFDIYVRIIARLDFLNQTYAQSNKNLNFEDYIKNCFFEHF